MWNSITYEEVQSNLPERDLNAHKGNFGRVLLLCGSVGYSGAAALAAMGALRAGAGLVYLGVPKSIYEIEAAKLLEPIVFPLPDEEGMLSDKAISKIAPMLERMDAVLIGPGLGISEGVLAVVKFVLSSFSGTVVLDADGINVLQQHKNILRERTAPTVITPHEGEFVRLGGNLQNGRESAVRHLAAELGAVTVLKGHNTLITDGFCGYRNTTGNPGMAVGGSGDVLAGILVALIGQGICPLIAAACAVWLHGAAGDICAREIGQYGMLPSDMLQVLPRLLK